MAFGLQHGRDRLFILPLIIIIFVVAGCSLSAPVGGGQADQTTIEGPPVVRIFSPLPNQTFVAGTTVNIQARIENAGSDIAKVSIFQGDQLAGEQANPNPSGAASFSVTLDWITSNEGQYQIAVVAERADGTSSNREAVSITVIKQSAGNTDTDTSDDDTDTDSDANNQSTNNNTSGSTSNPTATSAPANTSSGSNDASQQVPPPTATTRPSNTPAPPSNTPQPTASPTPAVPMALIVSGANLRRGPSTVFEPPVGSIAANQEAEIVAVNPGRTWYKIKYFNSEAWIFGNLVQTTGNLDTLPVDAGPPTPVPSTATPVPTATPIPNPVNLYVVNIQIRPHPLTCQESSEIQVTVGNNGTANAESGGKIRIEAVLNSTGAVLETTETIFGPIAAGSQETTSAFITVSTNFAELQKIRATVDVDGQVAENNESDNVSDSNTDYVLQKGDCG